MRTLCTFLPTVTTKIITGSSLWGTTSSKSELVKQRASSSGWSGLLASRDITVRVYRLRLEAELPPLENPSEMAFCSPWTCILCAWSLRATSPFSYSWSTSRYSFKNSSFTKFTSWWPRAIHCSTLCPNPLWNSHQTSFHGPTFLSVFWGNFSFSTTLGTPSNSLQDTRNLGLHDNSPLAIALGTFLLIGYGTYLDSILFSAEVSLTLRGRAWLLPLGFGCLENELPRFVATTSSALMWGTTCCRTSENVSVGFLINESLNGPTAIPCLKAVTITTLSWVWSLTISAHNRLR